MASARISQPVDVWLTVESTLLAQRLSLQNRLAKATDPCQRSYLKITIDRLNRVIRSIERATADR